VEVHRSRLCRASVHFNDFKAPLPEPLQDYINMLKRPRRHPSPGASRIPMKAPLARDGTKSSMRLKLSSVLLLRSWDEECGHPWVTRLEDVPLHNNFPPATFSKDVLLDSLGASSQAQPESCIGYVPFMHGSGCTAAFNTVQEEVIEDLYEASRACFHIPTNHARRLLLHPQAYFPFFTAQWTHKVHHAFAMPRGASDGAVIVDHLRMLFLNGLGDDGLLVNTSHVSMTFNGHSAILYIHWFDDINVTYHMERFWSGAVDEHDPCVMLRCILRNLEDWAVGERLEHIRASLNEVHAYAVARNAYDESAGRSGKGQRTDEGA
jgi:hypothetical protein